jgi:hypothetical protein
MGKGEGKEIKSWKLVTPVSIYNEETAVLRVILSRFEISFDAVKETLFFEV